MQQRLFFLIIFLYCQLIKSQKLSNPSGRIDLIFYYYSRIKPLSSVQIPIRTHIVRQTGIDCVYFLQGNEISSKTFAVTTIQCISLRHSSEHCQTNFESKYLSLQNIYLSTQYVLEMEEDYRHFKQILRNLSSRILYNKKEFELRYIMPYSNVFDGIDKSKNPYGNSLSPTSLIGIIFLGICAVIIFVLTIGWFAAFHCRRFTQNRIEKKQRKALAKSAQQVLDRSPIITFDANTEHNDYNDREPMCAICLETFKNKEKLRKLEICSHYFHITCIDPWLLSHQSCPLCNRNILNNPIPSISSSIVIAENEQHNDEITSTVNNNNNQTMQT
ncbi:unnamed protein product [Rotaria sp. Silwood1]|nr:unnamed protein product [Rotaria sp. Silwood1]CAF1620815.1 unnamed protein product [Rotaria sp. Silwood1]CAF3326504.1 unnamed protein product [Rotaria sp. Silwood1]CAF3744580.1 unnamed protein product [Rotaria sp. Silwood1]CAF3757743.1 unnamed protein product [Rotaria sp. Silwood1]